MDNLFNSKVTANNRKHFTLKELSIKKLSFIHYSPDLTTILRPNSRL